MLLCPECGDSRYPVDEDMDVVGTTRSPGLRRRMDRAGSSRATFKEATLDLEIYAGIRVGAKDVERVAEAPDLGFESLHSSACIGVHPRFERPPIDADERR